MIKASALIGFFVLGIILLFISLSSRQQTWNQVTSQHLKLTVSYPSSWRQSEDQTLFSLVDTKSKAKNFKSYIRISEVENKDNLFSKVYDLASNSHVDNLSEKSQIVNRQVTKVVNLTVDGQKAFEVVEESIMPGPYFTEAVYILRGDQILVFRLSAETKEELEHEKPLFMDILGRVRLS